MESKILQLTELFWNDIIFQFIFPLLSIKDLYQLRATSKINKHLVEEYFKNIKKLHLHSEELQMFGLEAFKVLADCCSNIRQVNFTACNWLNDDILVDFFKKNKDITNVNLSLCLNLSAKCLQPLIINSRYLKTLKLNNCAWFTSGCLETLTYHQRYLENIDFSSTCLMDEKIINMFFKKNSNLIKIKIENILSITDECLFIIGNNCKNLEKLNIRKNIFITENGIRQLLNYSKKLKILYIRLCPAISCKFIQEISKQIQVDKYNQTNEFYTIVKFPIRNYNFPPDEVL